MMLLRTGGNNSYYRSRILVEEEGEVFRKGIVLLGPAEMEGDYAGEELRREVRTSRNKCPTFSFADIALNSC